MHACMYVCVCLRVSVCMHSVSRSTNRITMLRLCFNTSLCKCVYVCMHDIHACMYIYCVYVQIHKQNNYAAPLVFNIVLYKCVYVCMHVYMYACAYTIYTYISESKVAAEAYMYIHTYIHACMNTHPQELLIQILSMPYITYTYTHTHACIYE